MNCGTLPADLAESELFGHVKGAFTGASVGKTGLLESANGGTVFLDEIGTVPPAFQVKLLTCIEEGKIRPVGSTKEVALDVRFIAATNLDMYRAIEEGLFRKDLYYRLSATTIDIAPLAQRRVDIVPILIEASSIRSHHAFAAEALEALLVHDWPGNVRELLNLAQTLPTASASPIDYHALPADLCVFLRQRAKRQKKPQDHPKAPSRKILVAELAAAGGNVSELARRLGKHRNQVVRWLDAYGIRD